MKNLRNTDLIVTQDYIPTKDEVNCLKSKCRKVVVCANIEESDTSPTEDLKKITSSEKM